MAKGFTSGGVDFDDLFDPDVVGDGPSASFLTSGGVALKYAALAYGTKRADVGFRNSSGVDVSNLWAAKGTAIYKLGFDGKSYSAAGISGPDGESFGKVKISLFTDGTWTVQRSTRQSPSWSVVDSGVWLPAGGTAADYSVKFSHVDSGTNPADLDVTNDAATYQGLGITREITFLISGAVDDVKSASSSVTASLLRPGGVASDSTANVFVSAN